MVNTPVQFPSTALLASGDGRDNQAAALAAGQAFGNSVDAAKLEVATRKRLRDLDPVAVTRDEVKDSRRRCIAIETTEAQVTYGVGNAGLAALIQANHAEMQANHAEMQANHAEMQAMRALLQNMRRRERNRENQWTPILVERTGPNAVGVAPPNFPATRDAVIALTGPQITALEVAYNLPVGHFGGATVALRRNAVLTYFTEY